MSPKILAELDDFRPILEGSSHFNMLCDRAREDDKMWNATLSSIKGAIEILDNSQSSVIQPEPSPNKLLASQSPQQAIRGVQIEESERLLQRLDGLLQRTQSLSPDVQKLEEILGKINSFGYGSVTDVTVITNQEAQNLFRILNGARGQVHRQLDLWKSLL